MKARVKKWGNSAAVRIPASIMHAAGLAIDEPVDVREEAGKIIIEPLHRKIYDFRRCTDGARSPFSRLSAAPSRPRSPRSCPLRREDPQVALAGSLTTAPRLCRRVESAQV